MKRIHIYIFSLITLFCIQSCASSNIRKANKAAKKRYKKMNKNNNCNCTLNEEHEQNYYFSES